MKNRCCKKKAHARLQRLIYIDGDRLRSRFGFQTQWLHCTTQNISHCSDSDSDPTPYFCIGQESESVLESVSNNVNEPKMHFEYFIQIDTELRFYRSKFETNAYTVSYLYKTETHEILGKMFVFSTVECTWRNGCQFL